MPPVEVTAATPPDGPVPTATHWIAETHERPVPTESVAGSAATSCQVPPALLVR